MASWGLITKTINTDDIKTTNPTGISNTAANKTGNVLRGLKAIPKAGRKTGADWKITVMAVRIPPIQILLIFFIYKNSLSEVSNKRSFIYLCNILKESYL